MGGLHEFYNREYINHGITDIVLFGDCRPIHRPAIELAKQHNIRIHVYEEGYFRPYWVTLERGGVNAHTGLPRDPEWYRNRAKKLPHFDNGQSFSAPFWKRAAYDVGYNFWAGLNPLLHHGVESHVPYTPIREYIGYLKRGIRIHSLDAHSRHVERRLIAEAPETPFYLLPLQLNSDAQILHHSPFESMAHAMQHVVTSFAKFAPDNSRLAVKIHPLDPGLVDYQSTLRRLAEQLEIDHRVYYLESGNLPALLTHTAGVVTVNSTVANSALIHGRPTIALGWALYDMPGLTYQGGLDEFWNAAEGPDISLFHSFRDTVICYTQINGGFYCDEAIQMAIQNSLPRLLSPESELAEGVYPVLTSNKNNPSVQEAELYAAK